MSELAERSPAERPDFEVRDRIGTGPAAAASCPPPAASLFPWHLRDVKPLKP